jgi:hypothetical protein
MHPGACASTAAISRLARLDCCTLHEAAPVVYSTVPLLDAWRCLRALCIVRVPPRAWAAPSRASPGWLGSGPVLWPAPGPATASQDISGRAPGGPRDSAGQEGQIVCTSYLLPPTRVTPIALSRRLSRDGGRSINNWPCARLQGTARESWMPKQSQVYILYAAMQKGCRCL